MRTNTEGSPQGANKSAAVSLAKHHKGGNPDSGDVFEFQT